MSKNRKKFFSTAIVSLIVMLGMFISTDMFIQNMNKEKRTQYENGNSYVIKSFANAIRFSLDGYENALNAFYDEKVFFSGNGNAIHDFLVENHFRRAPFFVGIDFVTKDGWVYSSTGESREFFVQKLLPAVLTPSPYPRGIKFSDMIKGTRTDDFVFVIARDIYDKDKNFIGVLAAPINVNHLAKLLKSLNANAEATLYLLDGHGNFLVNPNEGLVGKKFSPEGLSEKGTKIVAAKRNGLVEVENSKGQPIDLFFAGIDSTDYVVTMGLPRSYWQHERARLNWLEAAVLVVALVSIVLLTIAEMKISDWFEDRRLREIKYDPLTNLWTKAHFEEVAQKRLDSFPEEKFMLIEADIKGFKFINQYYGETQADKIIQFFGQRIASLMPKKNALVCRGFADHFYAFITVSSVRNSMAEFKEGLEKLNSEIEESNINFIPKFGISFLLSRNKDEKPLPIQRFIGQAAFAKSTIQDSVITQYAIYDSHLANQSQRENDISRYMKKALKNGEFYVVYQPKIDAASEKVVGAEALVRWDSPELGQIMPGEFISVFEKDGLITQLDFYVYNKVLQFLQEQIDVRAPIVPISVNVSRNHNKVEKFIREFKRIFSKYSVPEKYVQLELLERSLGDNNLLIDLTNKIHEAGFSVAIDDFGTGESSLNMLMKNPADVLKFDRGFMLSVASFDGQGDSAKSQKFIRTLIELAKTLGMETVFEGVETKEQADFLRGVQCDQIQGYYYSKPLSEENFICYLKNAFALG